MVDSAMYVITNKGCFRVLPEHDSTFLEIRDGIERNHIAGLRIGERIAAIGTLLINRPYIEKSLETTGDESETVCNLYGFDCVTFFETSWAIATMIKKYPMPGMSELRSEITDHRYRGGIGFVFRLMADVHL